MILPDISDPPRYYRIPVLLAERDWLTDNKRFGWRAKAGRVKKWREIAGFYALNLPKLPGAYIIAELRFGDARRRDPLNWAPTVKAILDGFVDAGVFPDDDAKRIIGPDLRLGPKVPAADRCVVMHIWPTGHWTQP